MDIEAYKKAKKLTSQQNSDCIKINNIEFYYDPDEIELDENLLNRLKKFKGKDKAYTLWKTDKFGIIIY